MPTLPVSLTDEQLAALQAICDTRNSRLGRDPSKSPITPADLFVRQAQQHVDEQKSANDLLLPDAVRSLDAATQKKIQDAVHAERQRRVLSQRPPITKPPKSPGTP